jgi:hypothetical protein
MAQTTRSPFEGKPATWQVADVNGNPAFRIEPRILTPLRATMVNVPSGVAAVGLFIYSLGSLAGVDNPDSGSLTADGPATGGVFRSVRAVCPGKYEPEFEHPVVAPTALTSCAHATAPEAPMIPMVTDKILSLIVWRDRTVFKPPVFTGRCALSDRLATHVSISANSLATRDTCARVIEPSPIGAVAFVDDVAASGSHPS